ncbi:thioesterase II family protein [Streptomyces sp. NPDC001678]|uniref:thioesterase II family protein n=1 Tax=Streptomyces sp. NPDC001678 TaxID=3364599 RepID=UPI0036BA797F
MARLTAEDGNWVRRYAASSGAKQVVCFPHAGGAAGFYRPWAMALKDEYDLLAVQYPGRQDRIGEPCAATMDEMVRRATAALLPELDRPTVFFGHSMGGLVAFEVARRLAAAGRQPEALFVSCSRAPGDRDPAQIGEDDESIRTEVRRLGGMDPRLLDDPALMEMLLPPLRGDFALLRSYTYVPGPPLTCDIVSLVGTEDPLVSPGTARRWGRYTSGGFRAHELPGDHFYLVERQAEVLGLLRRRPVS